MQRTTNDKRHLIRRTRVFFRRAAGCEYCADGNADDATDHAFNNFHFGLKFANFERLMIEDSLLLLMFLFDVQLHGCYLPKEKT